MLMRSDELYKFSDRTLTGLRTSLDDITKNIQIEYLPKRIWSRLEKKRANIMIKAIDKYFSFGIHLEDLHVTWAHLEKKRTRLRTNTKTLEDLYSQSLETTSQAIHDAVTTHKVTASQHFETASARTDSHADLEDSTCNGVTTKTRHRRVIFL
ncbi:hypothetical protein Tco_0102380, partial [Tanacetum coccineum]